MQTFAVLELKWILFFSAVAIYVSYWFLKRRNLPPGPLGIPILGYLPFLNPRLPYKSLYSLSRKYGSICGLYLGSIYTVVLSDVNIIREALKREEYTGRAPLYLTHGIMGGYGIICSEGLLWKDQRRQSIEWLKKLGMSKFGVVRNSLEKRIKAGAEECLQLINNMKIKDEKAKGAEEAFLVDPMHALHHSLGNVVNSLVFGITYKSDDATWKYLQRLQEEGVKHIGVSGVVNFLPILRLLPANRNTINFLLDGKRRTHAIYDKIIENVRTVLMSGGKTSGATESESAASMKACGDEVNDFGLLTDSNIDSNDCILKYFLCEKERRFAQGDGTVHEMYNDTQLRHLLADLFGAGVDTSLTTLRWFLLYMAQNRSLQAQLRTAIIEACADSDALDESGSTDCGGTAIWKLNLCDLEKLDLLKACISETQRIRSVVPLGIPHGTTEKTNLFGYDIPKNSMVIPLQWAVHMDPKLWPDPERFDPNRFLTDDGKYFTPSSFIPFQTGKRICLGEEMARMMLYIFASYIIRHYELTLPADESSVDMEGECGITLTPPNYKLIFQAVKQ